MATTTTASTAANTDAAALNTAAMPHAADNAAPQPAIPNTNGTSITPAIATSHLQAFAPQLIASSGPRDMQVVALAARYMRIRALAQPAVLIIMVSQSAMLACQDSLTPCLAVLLSVAVSLVLNIVCVAGLGWGLPGAAAITVATQYVGAGALLWALTRDGSQLKPRWEVPGVREVWSMLCTMGPLTVASMSKNLCYLMFQSTASTLSTACVAAHQAAFSVWWVGRQHGRGAARAGC